MSDLKQSGYAYAETRNMKTAHTVFRREFGLLPDLVQSAAPGDEERAKIIADHIRLMSHALNDHHRAEDEVLWPLLLARAPKEVDPVVHLAEGHHQRLDALLARTDARLAAWASGAPGEARDALALALRELAVVLFEHMGLEERLVLPVVERHIFTSEWEMMEQRSAAGIAPQDVPLIFGMALYEGGEEIVPEPLRADIVPVAPGVYADYAERLYGTRTPPRSTDVVFGAPHIGAAASA
jgi:hemerythrin-like domain-containing protein